MSEEKETSLARDIRITEGKEGYDATCKMLLADKSILVRILKECVREVKQFTIQEIEQMLDDDIRIGRPLLPDETRAPAKVHIDQTEFKTNYESTSYFDITFHLYVPTKLKDKDSEIEGYIKLYIDLEAQRQFKMPYHISTRGIYYGARDLSSQYEVEFTDSHYENLKKVYSIWICLNCPPKIQNTMRRYHFVKEDIVGTHDEPEAAYDLIEVIEICLGEPGSENYKGLLKMLEVLLSKRDVNVKKQILSEEYDIPMTENIERSLMNMCNLSEEIEERTELSNIRNIMETLGLTISQAMDALKIPKDKQSVYSEILKKA